MTGGSEYQTRMIKAPPLLLPESSCMYGLPPLLLHTNTLAEPASGLEQPRLRPHAGQFRWEFSQQIPLVAFLLARCKQVFRQMFPPLPSILAIFLCHPCHRPASLFFIPPPHGHSCVSRKKKNLLPPPPLPGKHTRQSQSPVKQNLRRRRGDADTRERTWLSSSR